MEMETEMEMETGMESGSWNAMKMEASSALATNTANRNAYNPKRPPRGTLLSCMASSALATNTASHCSH